MEMGSTDSLHGLAFGKKVYFQDGGGVRSRAPVDPPVAKKGRRRAAAGQAQAQAQAQSGRCQVEGCDADLAGAKAYYCRHKVCGPHSKSPVVIVAGLQQRFCQQCSRFHQLAEFDQGKRSCRRRLAGHNERRRKPPPVPLTPHFGRFASSTREDDSRFRNFLMDFTYPAPLGTVSRNAWPALRTTERVPTNQWPGFEVPTSGDLVHSPHSSMHGLAGGGLFNAPPQVDGVAGVSDSCCALSLLSNQPWSNSMRNEARTISASANSDGAPLAQPVFTANYMNNSWGFRCHGTGNGSLEMQHEMERPVHCTEAGGGRFSGELELALRGGRQFQDNYPSTGCSCSGNVLRWSL